MQLDRASNSDVFTFVIRLLGRLSGLRRGNNCCGFSSGSITFLLMINRKRIIYLLIILTSVCLVLICVIAKFRSLIPKHVPPLSAAQIQEAVKMAGGEELLAKEVSTSIARFRDKEWVDSDSLKNCPAVRALASLINGEIIGMWKNDINIYYIQIRRGGHFDYQFIYVFGTNSILYANSNELIPVGGPVYFRNTSKQK